MERVRCVTSNTLLSVSFCLRLYSFISSVSSFVGFHLIWSDFWSLFTSPVSFFLLWFSSFFIHYSLSLSFYVLFFYYYIATKCKKDNKITSKDHYGVILAKLIILSLSLSSAMTSSPAEAQNNHAFLLLSSQIFFLSLNLAVSPLDGGVISSPPVWKVRSKVRTHGEGRPQLTKMSRMKKTVHFCKVWFSGFIG